MADAKLNRNITLKEMIDGGYTIGDLLDILNMDMKQVSHQNEDDKSNLEERVTAIMQKIGIQVHIKGYYYVRKAIIIAYKILI